MPPASSDGLRLDLPGLPPLGHDPAAAEPLARLRARLVAWMEQIKDPLLNRWTGPQILEGRKV